MKFSSIINHLSERKFVRRKKYPNIFIAFGTDNVVHAYWLKNKLKGFWNISIKDLLASDWEKIEIDWNPFEDSDEKLFELLEEKYGAN